MNKVIISLFALIIIGTSCDEDFFNATKEIDLGEIADDVAVVARLSNEAADKFEVSSFKNFGIIVSRTKSVLDTEGFNLIENAEVKLTDDDGTDIEYFFHESGYYLPEGSGTPNVELLDILPNTAYTLTVDVPGEERVEAICETKSFGIIKDVNIIKEDIKGEGESVLDRIQIELEDPEGRNYYDISVAYLIKETYEGDVYRYQDNAYLFNYNSVTGGNVSRFTDELFDGTSSVQEFWAERYPINNPQISREVEQMVIQIKSLSKEEYEFARSIDANRDAEENPFAEPTVVFSNIQNGRGIFSISKSDQYFIDW